LIKRYLSRNEHFVKTEGYLEAKCILHKNHLVMITGVTGDGKSSVAIELLLTYRDTHDIVKVHSIEQLRGDLNRKENQIFLLDNAFGTSAFDKSKSQLFQSIIDEIKTFPDDKTLVVMASETSIFKEAQSDMKMGFLESYIVDLSRDFQLSRREKEEILFKYIQCKEVANEVQNIHGDLKRFVTQVAKISCPVGYPHCVVMFTNPERELLNSGLDFFKLPLKYLNAELEKLHQNRPSLYAFMLLLSLRKGRILEDDLDEILKDSALMTLLKNTSTAPKKLIPQNIKAVIEKYDGIYLKRFIEEGIVGFHHHSFMKALHVHFGGKYTREAIAYLPFEFSFESFRTQAYNGNENIIKLEGKHYTYLSQKFADEILLGNIQSICKHQACSDQEFAVELRKHLVGYHENSNVRLSPFEMMEREIEIRETFNGSILYWASVYGARHLVSEILGTGILETIRNQVWVQHQASAALVHACVHGFPKLTIERLLRIGAVILCRHTVGKVYEIKFCDTCNVFNKEGCSPLQGLLMGEKKTNYQKVVLNMFMNNLLRQRLSREEKRIIGKALKEAIIRNNKMAIELLFPYGDLNFERMEFEDEHEESKMSSLWYAVCSEDITLVENVLHNQNDPIEINETDELGKTILMKAKDLKTIQFLISRGCLVHETDHETRTALYFANNAEIAEHFIKKEKNLKVNAVDCYGMTPLHFLMKENDMRKCDIISTLLRHGANVLAQDSEDRFPLQLVQNTMFSNLICVHLKTDLKPFQEVRVMIKAVFETVTYPAVLENILDSLGSSKYVHSIDFHSCLLCHAKSGTLSSELLSFYLKKNVNVNTSNENGNILHHLCSIAEDRIIRDILKELESHCIDANCKDILGDTPLHLACALNQCNIQLRTKKQIITFLFSKGANVNSKTKGGKTPLHILVQNLCEGAADVLDMLIDKGIDANAQDVNGQSALPLLALFVTPSLLQKQEATLCVEKLVKYGVTIESRNLTSHISALLASSQNNVRIFEILVRHMANYNSTEILQILDICFASPNNIYSWRVIHILKSQNVIKVYPTLHSEDDDSQTSKAEIRLAPETISVFCDRLKVGCDIIHMMLGDHNVTHPGTIDDYFEYGLRFGSMFEIDITRTDEKGRNYLIRLIQHIILSHQEWTRHFQKTSIEGEQSDIDMIRQLLDKGIDVNEKDTCTTGHTALYYIVRSSISDEIVNEYVRLLIQYGADISTEDLLLLAATNTKSRTKVLETLLKDDVDKQQRNNEGRNAIFLLVHTFISCHRLIGDISASIRLLSKHGVKINERDNSNQTVLQYSIQRFTNYDTAHTLFKSDFIHVLLECGANPNDSDHCSGETVLHKAVMYNNYRDRDKSIAVCIFV